MFQNLIELFKTPAAAAIIAAVVAILSAPLTQRLTRRATELQWLRERRGQAYSELLTSLDSLGNAALRASASPIPANIQDFKSASEQFLHARSLADLYTDKNVSDLLGQVDCVSIQNAGSGNWSVQVAALAAVRAEIVRIARNQLGSAT